MSDANEDFKYASRAMLAGAMIGGTASVARQWQASQHGEITSEAYMKKVASDTLKAGAVSAVTTYAANRMVKQPILSMATILAVGVASAYLLSSNQADSTQVSSTQGNEHE